jgi:Phage major capsid protein E
MMLDVFRGDAFHFTRLIQGITRLPYQPTKLGGMGLFAQSGINTLTAAFELQDGKLTLVQTQARGSRGKSRNLEKRAVKNFNTQHLPLSASVMADEVINLRAFGSETEEETAMKYAMKKLAIPRRDIDLTHEWQRIGALKGVMLDADLSVIYNYFTEFGLTQTTHSIVLSSALTKVRTAVTAAKRKVEDKLGGTMVSSWRALCSAEFLDALSDHPDVQENLKRDRFDANRTDVREGFEYGDVQWEEYRGQIGGQRFIDANKAYLIPMGVPDMFQTLFSPAPDIRVAGTEGLPFYVSQEDLPHGAGIDYAVSSSPLHINTRPEAVCELTAT